MNQNARRGSWPYEKLALASFASLLMAGLVLPGLDGRANEVRSHLYIGISILFWIRVFIARVLRETNHTYYVYLFLILTAPWAISLIVAFA